MRRRYLGLAVVATTVAGVLASAAGAPAAGASPNAQRVLAPNHHLAAKPGGGGGGGGHGGGGGRGGGSVWPGWASSNWSGYAVTKGAPYTAVTGQWTVPMVTRTKSNTYSAAWIGIGGFNTADLIQTGTESDFVNGQPEYAAWWTTSDLGYVEQPIGTINVSAGDTIKASVVQNKDGTWTMTLTDGGQTFSKNVGFDSSESSAEWIMEAPGIGGRTAPLANYGTDTFDPDAVNGKKIAGFDGTDAGVLIQKGAIVSIPSLPDTNDDGFAISYGSVQPNPPANS